MELLFALALAVGLSWLIAKTGRSAPRSGRSAAKSPVLDAEFEPVSDKVSSLALALPPNLELLQVQPLFLSDSQRVIQAYQLQSLPPGSWPVASKKWQA
jgi:hypothetical protein